MKKILLLLVIIISHFCYSQNQQVIDKMNESKSIDDIKQISDEIVSKSKEKYNFLKIWKLGSRDEIYQYVVYTPAEMTTDQIKELTTADFDKCFVVKFGEFYKGENKDLELKGELTYYFKEVSGKYLDLVNFWTSTFYPTSTKEQIIDEYKLQEFRVDKTLKYKFKKDNDIWTLSKSY